MNRLYIAAVLLALAAASPAQVSVGAQVNVAGAPAGGTVSLDTYRTKVREGYVAAGVPTETIDKVIPLDVDIYNARVAGDTAKVRTIRKQQEEILTPTYTTKVRTYYKEHPYKVNIGSAAYPVWVDEDDAAVATTTTDASGDVVEVPAYEEQLRKSYTTIGLPENVISEILPIDVEIYNAYASGNTDQVTVLQEKRAKLIPTEQTSKVTTYFSDHPMKVKTKTNKTFTVWEGGGGGTVVKETK